MTVFIFFNFLAVCLIALLLYVMVGVIRMERTLNNDRDKFRAYKAKFYNDPKTKYYGSKDRRKDSRGSQHDADGGEAVGEE